jgi:hypothetical protein
MSCIYDFDKNLDVSETEDEASDAEEGALEADEWDGNEGLAVKDTEGSSSNEEEVAP